MARPGIFRFEQQGEEEGDDQIERDAEQGVDRGVGQRLAKELVLGEEPGEVGEADVDRRLHHVVVGEAVAERGQDRVELEPGEADDPGGDEEQSRQELTSPQAPPAASQRACCPASGRSWLSANPVAIITSRVHAAWRRTRSIACAGERRPGAPPHRGPPCGWSYSPSQSGWACWNCSTPSAIFGRQVGQRLRRGLLLVGHLVDRVGHDLIEDRQLR